MCSLVGKRPHRSHDRTIKSSTSLSPARLKAEANRRKNGLDEVLSSQLIILLLFLLLLPLALPFPFLLPPTLPANNATTG